MKYYNSIAGGKGIFADFDFWWTPFPLLTKIGILLAIAVFIIICLAVARK